MQETQSNTQQRKTLVVSSILNLYLFENLETPHFEKLENQLKKKVTSPYALHFLNNEYSKEDELIIEFLWELSNVFPENLKFEIYTILLTHIPFQNFRNFKLLDTLNKSTLANPIHLLEVDLEIHNQIRKNFIENNGSTPITNEFIFFLANFKSSLEIDNQNYITLNNYNYVIQEKIAEIERLEDHNIFK